jgi:hypothetical protein
MAIATLLDLQIKDLCHKPSANARTSPLIENSLAPEFLLNFI